MHSCRSKQSLANCQALQEAHQEGQETEAHEVEVEEKETGLYLGAGTKMGLSKLG